MYSVGAAACPLHDVRIFIEFGHTNSFLKRPVHSKLFNMEIQDKIGYSYNTKCLLRSFN